MTDLLKQDLDFSRLSIYVQRESRLEELEDLCVSIASLLSRLRSKEPLSTEEIENLRKTNELTDGHLDWVLKAHNVEIVGYR